MRLVCLLCWLFGLMSLIFCENCKVREILWAGMSGWGVKILEGWAEGLAVKFWWCEFDLICSELIVLYEISLFVVLVVWIDEFDILWKLQSSRNFVGGEVWVKCQNFGSLTLTLRPEILMMWIRLNLFRTNSTSWDSSVNSVVWLVL